jgi:hypothetical protein
VRRQVGGPSSRFDRCFFVVPFAQGDGWIRFSRPPWFSITSHVSRLDERSRGFMRFHCDSGDPRHCPSEHLPATVWVLFRSHCLLFAMPAGSPSQGTNRLVTLRPSAMPRVWNSFRHFASIKAIPNDPISRRGNVRVSLSIHLSAWRPAAPVKSLDSTRAFARRRRVFRSITSVETQHRRAFSWSVDVDRRHPYRTNSLDSSCRRVDFPTKSRFGESTDSFVDDKRETHFVCAIPRFTVFELDHVFSTGRASKIGKASIQTDRLAEFTYRFIILTRSPRCLDSR